MSEADKIFEKIGYKKHEHNIFKEGEEPKANEWITQDEPYIEYLDEKLDKASLRGLNQITVIHGYGTGALKSAVKDYLQSSPYVAKFRYGDETQGRDGVVIVDLL